MPDTLTVTDNRSHRTVEVPIEDGAVRATALREFGLMSYDPAFLNTASVRSAVTFIAGCVGGFLIFLFVRVYGEDEPRRPA